MFTFVAELCRDSAKRGGMITAIYCINEFVNNKNLQQSSIWAINAMIRNERNKQMFNGCGGRRAIEVAKLSHKTNVIPLRLKRLINSSIQEVSLSSDGNQE